MHKKILIVLLFVSGFLKAQMDSAMLPPPLISINTDRPGFSLNPQNPGENNAYFFAGIGTGGSSLYRYNFDSYQVTGTIGVRYGIMDNWEIGGYYLGSRQDFQLKSNSLDTSFQSSSSDWNLQTRYRFLNTQKSVLTGYVDFTMSQPDLLGVGALYSVSITEHFGITSNFIYGFAISSIEDVSDDWIFTLNLQFPVDYDFGLFLEGVLQPDDYYTTDFGLWYQPSNHFLWDLAYTQGYQGNVSNWSIDFGCTYSFAN